MRIHDILREDTQVPQEPDLLADFIKQNAQPWLSQTDQGYLIVYRGLKSQLSMYGGPLPRDRKIAFVKPIRTDRQTLNTSPASTAAFNAMIGSVSGIANRNNSAFVSSDPKVAEFYGRVFVFIPLGDFHYTWSPKYADWYQEFTWIYINRLRLDNSSTQDTSKPQHYDPEKVSKIIKVDQGLREAIKSQNEIMIQAASGLYIEEQYYLGIVLPQLQR
jgi:hypothetical protein